MNADQLFEGEKISGYKGLKIELFFTASELFTYFNITYEQRHETIFDDVEGKISSKMAPGWTKNLSTFLKNIKKHEMQPIGELVMNYNLFSDLVDKSTGESVSYSLFRSNFATPGLKAFHERLQFFLLFYIESSSYIDSSDPIWQLLLIYEKRVLQNKIFYFIVGYTTVYSFYSYPDSTKLRLSQILILPPYQRKGHGKYLLLQVYKDAQTNPNVIEVNIEDPSPGFQRLRDSVDLRLCIENGFFQQFGVRRKKMSLEKWDAKAPMVLEIKKKLKWTEKQILRCYEIFKLNSVDRDDAIEYKSYRLEIKTRLSHQYREELSVQNYDVGERKKKLQELYELKEREYLLLLNELDKTE